MSGAPKVRMFLSLRFFVKNFLNYVIQPTAYNYCLYCHIAMALKGGLKRTLKQEHAETKNESKGKRKFQNERRSLESLPFCRNWVRRLDFGGEALSTAAKTPKGYSEQRRNTRREDEVVKEMGEEKGVKGL